MLKLKLMSITQAKFKLICDRISGNNQCDQIGRFIGLWGNFKAFGNN